MCIKPFYLRFKFLRKSSCISRSVFLGNFRIAAKNSDSSFARLNHKFKIAIHHRIQIKQPFLNSFILFETYLSTLSYIAFARCYYQMLKTDY